jgi:arginine/ornithine N-succinyltransferase beta subunit
MALVLKEGALIMTSEERMTIQEFVDLYDSGALPDENAVDNLEILVEIVRRSLRVDLATQSSSLCTRTDHQPP